VVVVDLDSSSEEGGKRRHQRRNICDWGQRAGQRVGQRPLDGEEEQEEGQLTGLAALMASASRDRRLPVVIQLSAER
jgi:hypothetical protein